MRFTLVALLPFLFIANAIGSETFSDPNLKTLRAILQKSPTEIDLARVKLTVDRMIAPNIDIETNLKQLNVMGEQIKAMLPLNASNLEKMETLQRYIYQAGLWNGNKPFQYDLDDPLGSNIHNKLLPTYLSTRKGNCVSMPILFIILGQKIGLDVTASTAPLHVFVKYRLDDGVLYNFEATSGGRILDATMQRNFPMTPQALKNGIYMQPLSKKETATVMMDTLLEYYGNTGKEEQRIELAKLILKYYPKSVTAMLHTGSAYNHLLKRNFLNKYRSPNDIPANERPYFMELSQKNNLWFDKAEALGWRMPDAQSEANYRKNIERAKLTKRGESNVGQ